MGEYKRRWSENRRRSAEDVVREDVMRILEPAVQSIADLEYKPSDDLPSLTHARLAYAAKKRIIKRLVKALEGL